MSTAMQSKGWTAKWCSIDNDVYTQMDVGKWNDIRFDITSFVTWLVGILDYLESNQIKH